MQMHRIWQGIALASALAATPLSAQVQPPREMTLDEALAHAEKNAPALAVATSRSKRADADRAAAASFFPSNPTLGLGGGARVGGGQDGADVEIGLSQELEVAGEPGLRRDAADKRANVYDAELKRAHFDVHQRVHVSFHTALIAKDAERGADEALKYAEQLLDVAAKQVQAGEVSPLAEKLARAEVSRAKEQLLAAQQGSRSSRLELALVTGVAGGIEVAPKGALPAPEETAPLAQLIALARESQPELRVRRAEIEAAKAQVALADREAFPKPALGVSYAAEGVAPGSNATQQIVLATLEVPLPFWRQNDGERTRANVELQIAEAEQQAVLAAFENRIAQAKARVDSDAQRIDLHTSAVLPAVDENLRLVQQAFALGDADITDVMLARERLITSRREALDAYRDYFSALAALEAEVGAEVIAAHEEHPGHKVGDEHGGGAR
jgi:cobalt-zinc-cadmium efflux system outer membrane protein